jgi:hypothetical protein
VDTHLGDALADDAQVLLDLHLDGQPVGVPSEAAVDTEAAHRPVARHDVLDDAGQQVAVVRKVVGERRPVEEDVLPGAGALLDRTPERVAGLPALQDPFFQLRELDVFLDASHVQSSRAQSAPPDPAQPLATCGARHFL